MGPAAHSFLDPDRGFDVHGGAPVIFGARLRRLPLVMMLVIGLLLSLLHCATCGDDIAAQAPVSIATNINQGAPPDVPDQQLPCHSGHCLSHVVQQAVVVEGVPADVASSAIGIPAGAPLVALAALPLFKPPRA